MSGGKTPAFLFFVKDWLTDNGLRLCSLSARGMWIDMLCLMFNSEERGRLVTCGKPWTDEQIIGAVNCPDTLEARRACLSELRANNVAKTDKDGAVYNSRMVRDEHIRLVRAESGSIGGKQKASKTGSKTASKNVANLKQNPGYGNGYIEARATEEEEGGMGGEVDPTLLVSSKTMDLLHDWLGHARVSSFMLFEVGCLIRDFSEHTVQEGIKISMGQNKQSLPYLRAVVENGAQIGPRPTSIEEIPF